MTSERYLVTGGAGFIGSHLQIYGLETVCLCYFNVFGPRQDPNSPYAAVIPKFITYISKLLRLFSAMNRKWTSARDWNTL